jgi:hypothetical protein
MVEFPMKKIIFLVCCLLAACNPSVARPDTSFVLPDQPEAVFVSVTSDIASASIFTQSEGTTSKLLQEIQELAWERRDDLVAQPGWLYRRTRNENLAQDGPLNWQTVPNQYEQEEWLLLDGEGKIVSAISRILDDDQEPVQILLLKDGIWIDLTIGAISSAENDTLFDPNFGVSDLAVRLVEQGRQIHRNTIYHGCWYQGERYTISDGENYYEIVFNPHRSSLRWIKIYNIVEGSIILIDSLEMMIEEKITEPPADILAMLEE